MSKDKSGYLTRLTTAQDQDLKEQIQKAYDAAVHSSSSEEENEDDVLHIGIAGGLYLSGSSSGSEEDLADIMPGNQPVTHDEMKDMLNTERRKKRDKIEPTEFYGHSQENADIWMRKFEEYTQLQEHSDEEKKLTFSFLLRGVADIWYCSWISENEDTDEWKQKTAKQKWDAVKQAFKDKFATNQYVNIQKLENIKLSDFKNAEAYVNHLEKMGHVTGTVQNALIPYVLRGLPDEMRERVASQEIRTLDECIRRVYLIESLMQQRRATATKVPEVKALDSKEDKKLNVLTEAILQMSDKLSQISVHNREDNRDCRNHDHNRKNI